MATKSVRLLHATRKCMWYKPSIPNIRTEVKKPLIELKALALSTFKYEVDWCILHEIMEYTSFFHVFTKWLLAILVSEFCLNT